MRNTHSFSFHIAEPPEVLAARLQEHVQPHAIFCGQSLRFVGMVSDSVFKIHSYLPIPFGLPDMIGTFAPEANGTHVSASIKRPTLLWESIPLICFASALLTSLGVPLMICVIAAVAIEVISVSAHWIVLNHRVPLMKELFIKTLLEANKGGINEGKDSHSNYVYDRF